MSTLLTFPTCPLFPSFSQLLDVGKLGRQSAPKQKLINSHSSPFQDNVNTTLMTWIGSCIYSLLWNMSNYKFDHSRYEFFWEQRVERPTENLEKILYLVWVSICQFSVLCGLGSILGFYVSAFYACCTCRLGVSCKDRIIWDSWLACGLWLMWFLHNVRLYEMFNHQFTLQGNSQTLTAWAYLCAKMFLFNDGNFVNWRVHWSQTIWWNNKQIFPQASVWYTTVHVTVLYNLISCQSEESSHTLQHYTWPSF